jgi:hypothetical protein
MQDKLVDAKENSRPEDSVSREQNIPEVCFLIKYIVAAVL